MFALNLRGEENNGIPCISSAASNNYNLTCLWLSIGSCGLVLNPDRLTIDIMWRQGLN